MVLKKIKRKSGRVVRLGMNKSRAGVMFCKIEELEKSGKGKLVEGKRRISFRSEDWPELKEGLLKLIEEMDRFMAKKKTKS